MKSYLFVGLIFLIVACEKAEPSQESKVLCVEMEENDDYLTEDFKEGYTIQFPEEFSGEGLEISLTASFVKTSDDNINFAYNYLCNTDCILFFGDQLEEPYPDEMLSASQAIWENLDARMDFCIDNDIEAILYYNSTSLSRAKLFMQQDDGFYEGLVIEFSIDQLDRIVSIIKTIRKS